jgi:hypothetical protein
VWYVVEWGSARDAQWCVICKEDDIKRSKRQTERIKRRKGSHVKERDLTSLKERKWESRCVLQWSELLLHA